MSLGLTAGRLPRCPWVRSVIHLTKLYSACLPHRKDAMAASFLRSRLRRMPRLKALIKEGIRIAERLPRVTAGSIDGEFLLGLLARDDPVILDIGSNDGTHTRWFLDLFPRARVFSFEPDPRARKRYAANVVSDRAVLFDLAISDRDGLIEFYVSSGKQGDDFKDWDESGSIRKPKHAPEDAPIGQVRRDDQGEYAPAGHLGSRASC